MMVRLLQAVLLSGYVWFSASAILLIVAFVSGRLNVSGLLTVKGGRDDGRFSPTRLSTLIVTVAFLADYVPRVFWAIRTNGAMPDVPGPWLTALVGTQGVYLIGKATALLSRQEQRR